MINLNWGPFCFFIIGKNIKRGKGSHSVMSDSLRPHELQPTRLLRPQDPPGKSTGVGCHCLLQKHQRRHPKPLLLPQGSGIFGGSLKQQVPNGFEENKIHHYHSNIPSQPPEINTDSKCGQQFMHIILYKTWGNFLQYSCLENPMDGGAWWAAVHGVAKSRTRLSDFTFKTFLKL